MDVYKNGISSRIACVSEVLSCLQLEQYEMLFATTVGSDLNLFMQLNDEDLVYVGVSDAEHRERLLEFIAEFNKNKIQFKRNPVRAYTVAELLTVLSNTLKQVSATNAVLANMQRRLSHRNVRNTLFDTTHSTAQILIMLGQEAQNQNRILVKHLRPLFSQEENLKEKRRSRRQSVLSIATMTSILLALVFTWRQYYKNV